MMETREWTGVLTALAPVAHNGGEKLGTTSMFRRQAVLLPDGTREEVPILSGNSLRGKLRRIGMRHCCEALGYGLDRTTGEVRGLTPAAYYFLFSGGSLTTEGSKALDLQSEERLRGLIPLVSVFGGVNGSRPMRGKLKVADAVPLVREMAHLVPARYAEEAARTSYTQLLDEVMYTRRDDLHDAQHVHQLVAAPRSVGLLEVPTSSKAATPTQMLYHTETLCRGTRFVWRITLEDPTPLEWDAFLTLMALWAQRPSVGAKSAVGFGDVAVQFDEWVSADARTAQGHAVTASAGALYAEHLRTRGEDIRALLGDVR